VRDSKIAGKIAQREKLNGPHLQRIAFLQECLPDEPKPAPYETSEIQELVDLFMKRFDDELATLKKERRPGRPPVTREMAIKQQLELDKKEYDSGMWIPDLRDDDTLFSLRNWTGEWSMLNTMKFVRLLKDGTLRESSFPPKGQS